MPPRVHNLTLKNLHENTDKHPFAYQDKNKERGVKSNFDLSLLVP